MIPDSGFRIPGFRVAPIQYGWHSRIGAHSLSHDALRFNRKRETLDARIAKIALITAKIMASLDFISAVHI